MGDPSRPAPSTRRRRLRRRAGRAPRRRPWHAVPIADRPPAAPPSGPAATAAAAVAAPAPSAASAPPRRAARRRAAAGVARRCVRRAARGGAEDWPVAVRGDDRRRRPPPPPARRRRRAITDDMIEAVADARARAPQRPVAARDPRRRRTARPRRDRANQANRVVSRSDTDLPDMPRGLELNHPVRVPEKPALEGLEAEMDAQLGRDRRLSLRSHAAARRGLLDRHAAADRQRIAARRPRLLLHAHRHRRALPADARQGRVLSDGMGRQRAADRAARAELFRRALRSVAAVRLRRSSRRTSPASSRSRCRARTSSSCARG